MIKKFKNGNIVLDIRDDIKSGYYEKTIDSIENFYHHDMCMEDLYINQINGYLYIVDFNKRLVYDLPGGYLFKDFLELPSINSFDSIQTGSNALSLYRLNKEKTNKLGFALKLFLCFLKLLFGN